MFIAIAGLPGSGKSFFAAKLAKLLNAVHLNSDVIRNEMGKRGQYDEASKAAVYAEMQKQAEALLKQKKTVILDATFYKKELRLPYIRLAKKWNAKLKWIEVKATEKTIRQRMQMRRKDSEADMGVYFQIKARWEPLDGEHLTLWSDKLTIEEMLEKASWQLKS